MQHVAAGQHAEQHQLQRRRACRRRPSRPRPARRAPCGRSARGSAGRSHRFSSGLSSVLPAHMRSSRSISSATARIGISGGRSPGLPPFAAVAAALAAAGSTSGHRSGADHLRRRLRVAVQVHAVPLGHARPPPAGSAPGAARVRSRRARGRCAASRRTRRRRCSDVPARARARPRSSRWCGRTRCTRRRARWPRRRRRSARPIHRAPRTTQEEAPITAVIAASATPIAIQRRRSMSVHQASRSDAAADLPGLGLGADPQVFGDLAQRLARASRFSSPIRWRENARLAEQLGEPARRSLRDQLRRGDPAQELLGRVGGLAVAAAGGHGHLHRRVARDDGLAGVALVLQRFSSGRDGLGELVELRGQRVELDARDRLPRTSGRDSSLSRT